MGQKVNPHGLRVGVIKDWDSRWYARDEKVGDLIVEDYNLRKYLKKTLYSAGVPKIEIERDNAGENGKIKISQEPKKLGEIEGYLKPQRRFRGMTNEQIQELKREIIARYEVIKSNAII